MSLVVAFDSIPETYRNSVKVCTWAIWRGPDCTWAIWRGAVWARFERKSAHGLSEEAQSAHGLSEEAQFGPDLNGTILFLALPVQLSLWPGCFLFSLACYLPICKVWSTVTQSKDGPLKTGPSAASQILYLTYYLALWPVLNSCYSALYASCYSALYTSWLREFMQPQPHTLDR